MGGRSGARWGVVLLVPAGLIWLFTMVWPGVRVVLASLHPAANGRPTPSVPSIYGGAIRSMLPRVVNALLLVPLPLLVFVAGGLALGWFGTRVDRRSRLIGRCLLVLPLACFVPALTAAAWWYRNRPPVTDVIQAGRAMSGLPLLVLVAAFGSAAAGGAVVYLAAFRGGWRVVSSVTGIAVLSALALGLQVFDTVALVRGAYPRVRSPLPLPQLFTDLDLADFALGARPDRAGPAAEVVVLFVVLALLGVAAVAVVLRSRFRVTVAAEPAMPDRPADRRHRVGYLVAIGVVLVLGGYFGWPWLHGLFAGATPAGYNPAHAVAVTWLPALPSSVVGVVAAVLAAFGIGAVRPFGSRSELLLLPFAPWLFVGIAPYAAAAAIGMNPDQIGLVSHTPPVWLNVPVLVLFTLLFAGQESAYRQALAQGRPVGAAALEAYLRPVLPAVVLAALAVWAVQATDYFWWAVVQPPEEAGYGPAQDVPLQAYSPAVAGSPGHEPVGTATVTPVPLVLLVLLVLIAAQFYLERWAASHGEVALADVLAAPPDRETPITAATGQRPQHLRTMVVCGCVGLVLAGAAVLTNCAGPSGPRLPTPGLPGAAPSSAEPEPTQTR